MTADIQHIDNNAQNGSGDVLKLNCNDVLKLIRPDGTLDVKEDDNKNTGRNAERNTSVDAERNISTTQETANTWGKNSVPDWLQGRAGTALPPLNSFASPSIGRKTSWLRQTTQRQQRESSNKVLSNGNGFQKMLNSSVSKQQQQPPTLRGSVDLMKGGGYRLSMNSRSLSPIESKVLRSTNTNSNKDTVDGKSPVAGGAGVSATTGAVSSPLLGRKTADLPSYQSKLSHYMNQKRELTKQIHLKSSHVDFHTRPEHKPKLSYSHNQRYPTRNQKEPIFRDKIEEFRRWHERERLGENARHKTSHNLKTDYGDRGRKRSSQLERSKTKINADENSSPNVFLKGREIDEVDVGKIVSEKSRLELRDDPPAELKKDARPNEPKLRVFATGEVKVNVASASSGESTTITGGDTDDVTVQEPEQTASLQPRFRTPSARTWRTWRNANDSYAYRNVRAYIDDNELMPKKKKERIQSWVDNVDVHMGVIQELGDQAALSSM